MRYYIVFMAEKCTGCTEVKCDHRLRNLKDILDVAALISRENVNGDKVVITNWKELGK